MRRTPLTERYHQPRLFKLLPALCLLGLFAATAQAQQPFTTDDADVTPKRKFHLQVGNEYDILQRSAYPALRQNTASLEISYGLVKNVEIGFTVPLLGISSSQIVTPRSALGVGDSTLNVKYNFYKEKKGSRLPSMALSAEIQFPTGDTDRGPWFGSHRLFHQWRLAKITELRDDVQTERGNFLFGQPAIWRVG